ncbi:hypothetical protein H310_06560 [Aphanomyces invadans]|uniref:Uncharacterized protein n=1 Tax=Aphanomyces invadans TaxID=157072 RepID=A0A024U4W1_9STRA|nr:hypothetical protein H310_06560 [Aphanomyces invadans]ETW00897.1 hypothetical protein H310_06560 [Aphanomyces invadans]|eukprot:XP_008869895.1 hypothetical protein H310_06560 [Aphanomyces invadans]
MEREDFDFDVSDIARRTSGLAQRISRSPRGGERFQSPQGRQPWTAAYWTRHETWTVPVAAPVAANAAPSDGAAVEPAAAAPGTTSASAPEPARMARAASAASGAAEERDDESMGVNDPMFMREYNQYLEQKLIAMREMNEPADFVTEAEWVAWMRLGFDVLPSDLEGIRTKLRGAVKFDLSITDGDSRIRKMLVGLMKAIELDNQEWVLREEDKMKPAGLQEAVQEEIAMHRNKTLKTGIFKFVRWLREYATKYQMFVKLQPEDCNPPKGNKPNTGAARAGGGSDTSGRLSQVRPSGP